MMTLAVAMAQNTAVGYLRMNLKQITSKQSMDLDLIC